MLNDTYGISKPWPKQMVIDHDTYANIVYDLIQFKLTNDHYKFEDYYPSDLKGINIVIGEKGGIMFKGVELLLEHKS